MRHLRQNRLEWTLFGLIALGCAGLSVLQYRWIGEVSRAEGARLRASLDEQARRFAHRFNEELRENCRALLPEADELAESGVAQAHQQRYQDWAASHDVKLLARIAVAVREQDQLQLYALDSRGALQPAVWPTQWAELRASLVMRAAGEGGPPRVPADSTLIEMPVLASDGRRRGPGRELEWMIFEVDEGYVRDQVLPRLVREYLNPGEEANYDVSVQWWQEKWSQEKGPLVFATRADRASVIDGADRLEGLFPRQIASPNGHRRRRGNDEDGPSRWVLAVRHRVGSLEAAVTRSRWLNLATSLGLIVPLGSAAWVLVRYTGRARRLAETQFRFTVGMSHDLRTPLTAIRGAAFNLAEGVVQEPTAMRRYGQLILRNAEELTSMIEKVLAYSQSLRAGQEEPRREVAIGELVKQTCAAITSEAEQAGCVLEVTVAEGLPAVSGDPVALEFAVRNLISNAARYAAEGKWIGVSVLAAEGGVEMQVADRGPGIPDEELERIFEPFYRGERSRNSQVRGTGLGLSLVKETAERHGGRVTVVNRPEGGATFTLWLPGKKSA